MTATAQTTIPLNVFRHRMLPLLQAKHDSEGDLQRGIETLLSEVSVVDDDGRPVDVSALVVKSARDDGGDTDESRIAGIVRRTLAALSDGDDRAAKAMSLSSAAAARRDGGGGAGGFKCFGEFATAVHKASAQAGAVDPRLIAKSPTTFANEGAGDSGGFLVPQDWADQIWQIVLGDESLLSRTNQIPTMRNSLSLPVNQNMPWSNGGVQAYWTDEGRQIEQSRPRFEYRNLRLHKLAALIPASDELLEDVTALDAFIGREAGRAIRYKADSAILGGDGVAKPLGILNSAAAVTVAKETSQTADTLTAANVAKMYARMPATSINSAIWLMNQDVLPQLLTMTLGNQPIYLPPNGIADAPFGTLLGRPVHFSQHAKTLGDRGDVLFADFTQYLTLTKSGGIKAASSIHLWFDYDLTAFRFTFRVAGEPWLSAPITPDNGSAELSPFVLLADRA